MTETDQPQIVDHVFRPAADGHDRAGTKGGSPVRRGMCCWLGRCNRPPVDHITVPDYRAARKAAA